MDIHFKGTLWLYICLTFHAWSTTLAADGKETIKPPLVTTKYGQLQGKLFSVKGTSQEIEAYFGIPFAKPPIGQLRFSPPQSQEPWNNLRDASSYPPLCLQMLQPLEMLKKLWKAKTPTFDVSEDCLYLNVYTPAGNKQHKLPVMVWIHGGAFINGGASYYDGSALSAYENVVVVSIQYRLGTLGFFSTGDEHAHGNWGLLDQVAALQWVQENIFYFGGNPDSVTIFGDSAGGISVSALVLSPLSKGLFHKAISQSGSIFFPGLFCTEHEVILLIRDMIANATGCETLDSAAIVNCMRKKTEEEILEPVQKMKYSIVPAIVDGVFLTKNPEDLMAGKECNPVPYLMGVNNDECGWLFPSALNISNLEDGIKKETAISSFTMLRQHLGLHFEFMDVVTEEYMGDTEDPFEIRDSYLEMLADIMFINPAIKTAKFHRDSGLPVYFYNYQHRPSIHGDLKPAHVKADHGDEVASVLGFPFLEGDITIQANFTDEEKNLSRTMMNYWANFARNGNPNGDGLMEWPAYGLGEQYLEINLQQKAGKKLKDHRITFWSEKLPEKMKALNAQKKQHAEL
ncbi:fatty acyl-CoA hydrolase precursor, medium chain-like isoform X2 [Lissotriton helveticus]